MVGTLKGGGTQGPCQQERQEGGSGLRPVCREGCRGPAESRGQRVRLQERDTRARPGESKLSSEGRHELRAGRTGAGRS